MPNRHHPNPLFTVIEYLLKCLNLFMCIFIESSCTSFLVSIVTSVTILLFAFFHLGICQSLFCYFNLFIKKYRSFVVQDRMHYWSDDAKQQTKVYLVRFYMTLVRGDTWSPDHDLIFFFLLTNQLWSDARNYTYQFSYGRE